jgi:hypothetical protein
MSQQIHGDRPGEPDPPPATDPPDASDSLETRLLRDEDRLAADEARLGVHERRLTADEERLTADEATARTTRVMSFTGVGLAGALVLAVAALVIAIAALRQDVRAIENAAPSGSVGTAAIRESAVTATKLATGSVGADAVQPGAVTARAIAAAAVESDQLAQQAVRGRHVARAALSGAHIREETLARVPSAQRSRSARTADDARALGGRGAAAYVAHLTTVQELTALDGQTIKGPLTARCRAGTRVLSGGAAIEGAARGVAVATSAPGKQGWTSAAQRLTGRPKPWRLVVTAICARGGS